jgi:hypothetical protein
VTSTRTVRGALAYRQGRKIVFKHALHHRRMTVVATLTAVVVSLAGALLADDAEAQLAICQRSPWLAQCQEPTEPPEPPPAPSNSPVGALELARQTTDRGAVRVVGWAADADSPQSAVTVRISVDGGEAQSVAAGGHRADVGASHPQFGPAHGYDVTVPAPATATEVCVTAVNIGSGTNFRACLPVDNVLEFQAGAVDYHTDRFRVTSTTLESLRKVAFSNGSTVQQSVTFADEQTVQHTHGWSDKLGLKITGKTKVNLLVWDGDLTIEGSGEWVQNGSHTVGHKWTWTQPLLVPAMSKLVATAAVSRSTVEVPYTMTGHFVYDSGHAEAGSVTGIYTGIGSYDFVMDIKQYSLDGSPTALTVEQPPPALVSVS